jgi:hypothetical protein
VVVAAVACGKVLGLTEVPPVAVANVDGGQDEGASDTGFSLESGPEIADGGAQDSGAAEAASGEAGPLHCDHHTLSNDAQANALVCKPVGPAGVQVHNGTVYWTVYEGVEGGSILSIPVDGGTSTTIAAQQNHPWGLAVDDQNVYWVNYANSDLLEFTGITSDAGSVMQAPLDGGSPLALATGVTSPFGIAIDETNVYFTTSDGNVESVPIGGGAATTLMANQALPRGIAVDRTYVYWANFGLSANANNPGGSIARVNKNDGGSYQVLANNTDADEAIAIAVDSNRVYFATYGSGGQVMSVPIDGDAGATVLAPAQSTPLWLAIDSANVYWTNSGLQQSVMTVPLGGGTPRPIVSDGPSWMFQMVLGIAVDSTSLYFVMFHSGRVWKLTPK